MNVQSHDSWLPLTDYSTKYKISVSTLRRRIKADDISFRFEEGKYFIMDEPMGTHQRVYRPSQESVQALVGAHQGLMNENLGPSSNQVTEESRESAVLLAANRLINELKQAYSQILREKEEEILYLKEDVSDLKTLVRVLESENDRLQGFKQ